MAGEIAVILTNGTLVLNFVKEVGLIFTEFPFILVPIAALIAVGYKYSGKVFAWVKGRWG